MSLAVLPVLSCKALGLCLPAPPLTSFSPLTAHQSCRPPGHTLYWGEGAFKDRLPLRDPVSLQWLPKRYSSTSTQEVEIEVEIFCILEIEKISFLKVQRSLFFGILKKN